MRLRREIEATCFPLSGGLMWTQCILMTLMLSLAPSTKYLNLALIFLQTHQEIKHSTVNKQDRKFSQW